MAVNGGPGTLETPDHCQSGLLSPDLAPAFPAAGLGGAEGGSGRRVVPSASSSSQGARSWGSSGTDVTLGAALGRLCRGADGALEAQTTTRWGPQASAFLSIPPQRGPRASWPCVTRTVTRALCSEGPACGLMLCRHCLKILSKLGGAPVSFCVGPGNSVAVLNIGK